jgi:hypothetical protein
MLFDLALGKCQNWRDANVSPLPISLDVIDMANSQIVHVPTTCEELEQGVNPLPENIGLVPAKMLPHFALGYTWGQKPVTEVATPIPAGSFSGVSSFTTENRGMVCSESSNTLGNNVFSFNSAWNGQCIYLLDGKIEGKRAVGLIRGVDLTKAVKDNIDASVWPCPAGWVCSDWAKNFLADNCGKTPFPLFLLFESGAWVPSPDTYTCP